MKREGKKTPYPISVQIPDDLLKRAQAEAARRGVSRSVVIRWALIKFLESADVRTAV